jgi:hypothetical protein
VLARTGYSRKPVVLRRISGDVCGEQSFVPVETELQPGKPVTLAPAGGRPSNATFPFFNLLYGDEGLFAAIGWSGQWAARATRDLGCDTHWLDAVWFEGGFPDGVGNWFCRPQGFSKGLKPVSEACHEMGLKFLVWFEPERVARGTRLAREHPEFVFGGKEGGLFKLGDPPPAAG